MISNANTAARALPAGWKITSISIIMGCVALAASPAYAFQPVDVITTGIVSSGTDSANQLGLGTIFSGQAYTLSVIYPAPDANYAVVPGALALDYFDLGVPSSATLTIGASVFTTALTTNYGSSLTEGTATVLGVLSGADAGLNTLAVQQSIFAAADFIANPGLQSWVPAYSLNVNDSGSDTYSWTNAAGTQTISITGTTNSVAVTVPEPASMALLGTGVIALLARRRRRG